MKIIVGLGNPDRKYDKTYHNIGFWAVSKLALKFDAVFTKNMCDGIVAETWINGEKVLIVKPQTYMNLSGICLYKLMRKFKVNPQDVFVFVDDLDLPLGKVRYRESGSAGTHNGLRSIVDETGTTNFKRIKIGIGRDERFKDIADFVLSKIPEDKLQIVEDAIDEGVEILLKQLR